MLRYNLFKLGSISDSFSYHFISHFDRFFVSYVHYMAALCPFL